MAHLLGAPPAYHIVDEEKLLLLDQAVRHVFYDMEEQTQGAYRYSQEDRESTVRSMHGVFNALEGAPRPPPSGLQGRVLQKYEEFKARDGGWDFRDLLVGWRDYIRSPRWPRGAFRHVLIDEVQDLNPLQLEILDALHADGAQLVAIGDDAQAIYGFRGSRVDAILDFEKRYAPAAQPCCAATTATRRRRWPGAGVIAQNTRRVERTITSMVDPATLEGGASSPCRKRRRRRRHDEMTVLAARARARRARFPHHTHSCWAARAPVPGRRGGGAGGGGRAVQPKARREQEPARPGRAGPAHGGGLLGGRRRRRASGGAVGAPGGAGGAGRAVPGDAAVPPAAPHPSRLPAPARARADHGLRHARRRPPPAAWPPRWTRPSRSWRRPPGLPGCRHAARPGHAALRLLQSAAAAAAARGAALLDYVNEVVQETTPDTNDTDASAAVQLMTVHQAKGLEADAVHVVGLQDGEFPMKRGDVDEEVRVLYVALTRARHYLGWTRGPGLRPSRLLPPPPRSGAPQKEGRGTIK